MLARRSSADKGPTSPADGGIRVYPFGNHLSMIDPTGTRASGAEDRHDLPDRNATVYA